uniref:Ig-like domain-containing protein n=1 Tax=Xenopus tropicalis TaxID=8364 RepID=A0A1B8Y630_XENTR
MINMKNLLYLISVLTLLQCVRCQISLTQPGAVTVNPSEVLQLPCKVTGASLTDSSKIYSVFLWAGVDRRDMAQCQCMLCPVLAGTPTTVSRDTNKVYLILTGMKPEKTAVYYCAR